jgi:hypothetical protein
MDKTIQEFKLIETDDGYRIEIKGDKKLLKSFFEKGQGMHGRRFMRGFPGPFGGPAMWRHMAQCHPEDLQEEEEK